MNSNYMWIVLAVVVVFGVYVAYEYSRIAELARVGRATARDASAFQRDTGTTSILVLGDSTAVGVGSAPEESVAGRMSAWLDAAVENRAVSGAQIVDVLEQIRGASRSRYDLVLIHAGANDVIYGTGESYTTLAENTDALLSRAHELSDRVVMLTAGDIGEPPIWPLPVGWYLSHRTQRVRDIIKPRVEAHGGVYVDFYMFDDPFASDPQRYYAPDFLHLSGEGYRVWFEFIRENMQARWSDYENR